MSEVFISDTKAVMAEYGPEIHERIGEIIASGKLASGAVVKEAEDLFATKIGVDHAKMVSNGTTALVAALKSENVGPGDEVIMPAFSFNATLNSVLSVGATAVLADIDPNTYNLDIDKASALINEKTKAIMPVHIFGQAADMDPIVDIAEQASVAIIEDAAQAHGAKDGSRSAGSFGVAGFSCYPTKNISAPEAGFVTTNDEKKAHYVEVWRNQGMGNVRYDYEIAEGTNARSNNIAAAFVIPQIQGLEHNVERRSKNASALSAGLADTPGITPPFVREEASPVWHQYTIRVEEEAGISRDELKDELAKNGIGSGVYYPRVMSDYGVYDAYKKVGRITEGEINVARKVVGEVLSLPVHPYVSDQDIQRTIQIINRTVELRQT